jgi:hypothetical protein
MSSAVTPSIVGTSAVKEGRAAVIGDIVPSIKSGKTISCKVGAEITGIDSVSTNGGSVNGTGEGALSIEEGVPVNAGTVCGDNDGTWGGSGKDTGVVLIALASWPIAVFARLTASVAWFVKKSIAVPVYIE